MSPEFKEYVNQLVIAHRDERIYPFQYEGKKFWLKQPEKLKGIWLLLKPRPKQSFKNELQTLLNENVAKLLEHIPVYTLDKNNMRDVLIKKFAKEIRIEKGQLSLETSMFQ